MAGTALYREWRPKTFREVVEQEHVVTTLKNSVVYERLSHAYLFSGTRGSGKTTLAHVFSRAVNCLTAKKNGGEPCNSCDVCLDILAGRCMDIIEIDAASNNGVDHVRSLRADIVYAPSAAKYKVYIIDEVHMLSGGAFNALLKTLEEPPEYAIFILATTEPHKLPVTVLSRCQRFDFRRITPNSIAKRLEEVAKSSGAEVTSEALLLIAGLADGSLRDAISVLDQCLSFGAKTLTRETVLNVVGLPEDDMLLEFARILTERDLKAIPAHTDRLLYAGKSLTQYLESATDFLRDTFMIRIADESSCAAKSTGDSGNAFSAGGNGVRFRGEFANMSDSMYEAARTLADKHDLDYLIAATNEVAALVSVIRHSTHQRAIVEVCLAKLCLSRFGTDSAIMELNTRVSNLESMIAQSTWRGQIQPRPEGRTYQPQEQLPSQTPQSQQQLYQQQQNTQSPLKQPPSQIRQQTEQPPSRQHEKAQKPQRPQTVGHEYQQGRTHNAVWLEIVGHFKKTGNMRLFSMLQTATSGISADCFFIVLPEKTASLINVISLPVNIAEIAAAVKEQTGQTYKIRVIGEDTAKSMEWHTAQNPEENDPLMSLEKVMREKYNIPTTVYP